MTALSPAVGRLLAVTILVAAAAAVWALVVEPVSARFDGYERSIAQSRELLARQLRIAAERGALESRLDELRGTRAASGRFLEGGSIELVAAQVQNTVKTLIDSNGATFKSTQALPPEGADGFRKVTVRVNMTADTQALQTIFYAVETAERYLFMDNVDIRSRRPRARRNQPATQSDLQVRFDVYGYMQGEGP
ncbi:MAG: type II secretion system protein GspM [Alphaproteobacteria bacterium]|jgi:general secretion pathway protein M